MSILDVTILNATQGVVEFGADGTRHGAGEDVVGLVLVEVVDAIDRRDDGSGAAHGSLVEEGEFLNRHRTDLDLQTQVASHLLDGHVGDGRQDGLRVGSDVGVAIDAEEVGRTALVDELLAASVEIDDGAVALLVGQFARNEAGCIVATHLDTACAERCCTVEAAHNAAGSCLETILEVRTYRHHKDNELIFVGWRNTNLRTCTEEHWTNVHGATRLVRRNEMAIELHDLQDCLLEESIGKWLHQNGVASGLKALGILVHAENTDLAILAAESLEAFEASLAIVQHSGGHMHGHFLTLANTEFTPRTILVGATYIVRSLAVTEAQTAPIDLFCHFLNKLLIQYLLFIYIIAVQR